MIEDRLTDKELELFKNLNREIEPSKSLEGKVISELEHHGLLQSGKYIPFYVKAIVGIAASMVFFIAGLQYGRTLDAGGVNINPENGYILLINEDTNFQPGDPLEMFNEYSIWMENIAKKGIKIKGQELKGEVATVRAEGNTVGYQDVSSKRTTGYFLVEARSPEEALSIAQANPHLKYGGTIDVKPFIVR